MCTENNKTACIKLAGISAAGRNVNIWICAGSLKVTRQEIPGSGAYAGFPSVESGGKYGGILVLVLALTSLSVLFALKSRQLVFVIFRRIFTRENTI